MGIIILGHACVLWYMASLCGIAAFLASFVWSIRSIQAGVIYLKRVVSSISAGIRDK